MAAPHAVTRLLIEWRNGDQAAFEQLMALLYGELRDLAALDDALNALAASTPAKSKVVELRFFGGLEIDEIAEALDLSVASVGRELRVARACSIAR